MRTKIFALVSALFLSAQLFAYDFIVDGIYYNFLGGDSVEVTQGNSKYVGEITIPSTVSNDGITYRVTTIGDEAFYECEQLTSLTIPKSITFIGRAAFYNLYNLTTVTWNATKCVSEYDEYPVFGGDDTYDSETGMRCPWEGNVTSFILGEDVEVIPSGLCRGMTKLTDLTIPANVHTIGGYAFADCTNLTELTIPANVHTIGGYAFANLSNLKTVTWNAIDCEGIVDRYGNVMPLFPITITVEYSSYLDHNQTITSLVFGDGVKTIPAGICSYLTNLTNIAIPNSVTKIGAQAFYDSGLTELVVPENVDTVDENAFANLTQLTSVTWNAIDCYMQYSYSINSAFGTDSKSNSSVDAEDPNTSITSFTFGNNVEKIPANLCQNLSALTNIVIPTSVTSIGEYAFNNCAKITALTVPTNVNSVGNGAFDNMNSLQSVTWNAKQCNTEDNSFDPMFAIVTYNEWGEAFTDGNPSITAFTFGNDVEIIPAYVCCDLNLTNITIPSTVTTIGTAAFRECELLETITIPANVERIGEDAFLACYKIKTIDIPNSVKTIDYMAFAYCSSLQSATLGEGVDTIGNYAFYGCNQLKKFICHSPNAVEDSEYFDEYEPNYILCCTQLDTIIAPANIFDKPEHSWSYLAKNIRYIQVNGGELTTDAFGVINRSYKAIGTLDIAATTNKTIADEAFKGCYQLEKLLLPSQLERIGYMAVADCKNLQAIDIPATVTDIDDSAFENCRSIETLTFGGKAPAGKPASDETHHQRVSTAAESALERIGNWAFYNCHELQQLEIPEGVTEVGAAAFYGCVYLEDLTLPSTVQSIGDNCFALCSKLKEITCLATVPPTIEAKTFYDVNRAIPLYVPETSINDYANDTYWGEFINPQAAETPNGVDNILLNGTPTTRKVLHNGTIYILREGEKYTIDGRRVE